MERDRWQENEKKDAAVDLVVANGFRLGYNSRASVSLEVGRDSADRCWFRLIATASIVNRGLGQ